MPILGLLLLLIVIGIIIGPRHRTTHGYFQLEYAGAAPGLSRGAPVVLGNRVIGTVLRSEVSDSHVQIEFQVEPRFDAIVASEPAYVEKRGTSTYIQVGGRPPPSAESLGVA